MTRNKKEHVIKFIQDNKYNFFTGVPDSSLGFVLDFINKNNFTNIPACIESEAIGIAFGAKLAGGKPLVYMQNLGFAHCIESISSLLIPTQVCIDLLISHRSSPEHHKVMGNITLDLIDLLHKQGYNGECVYYYGEEK